MLNFVRMKNDKCQGLTVWGIVLIIGWMTLFSTCQSGTSPKDFAAEDSTASDAIRKINQEISSRPNDPELYYRKARIYYNEFKAEKALGNIETAVNLDSTNAIYHFHKGEVLFALNKTKLAAASFEKAIEINPDYYDAYIKSGELYLVVKEHKKSLEKFTKAQELSPAEAKPYFYKGMNFKEVRDTANAIISFQRAVELDNNYPEPHIQLALIYAARKDKLALQYFNAALKLNEYNTDALYARALYLQEQGKFDGAVKDYRTLLSVNKDDYRAHYNIGFINFINKKYMRAIENFSQAIMIYPEYTEAYYMRGLCHEAEGRKQDARNNYEYALQLDTAYAKAIEGKKRLQ